VQAFYAWQFLRLLFAQKHQFNGKDILTLSLLSIDKVMHATPSKFVPYPFAAGQ